MSFLSRSNDNGDSGARRRWCPVDNLGRSATRLNGWAPARTSARLFAATLVALGFVQVLGAYEVRIGAIDIPTFSIGWLFVASSAAFFMLPRSTARPPRWFGLWTLLFLSTGSSLLYWWADVSTAPSRLVAAVRREARAEDRPDRHILMDEISVADRRALRTLTGFRRHVRLTMEGFVHLPSTGSYQFEMRCDDHCALTIGTRLIGRGSAELIDARLEAGTYPFRVSYQQGSGPALVSLEWNRPRFVELLPMRKLVSGRQELLSPNRLRLSAIHIAALVLLSTCWWMFFAVGLARAAESRQALYRRLALGWDRLNDDLPPDSKPSGTVSLVDGVIIGVFVLLGVLFQFAHISSSPPHVILNSDAGNIATFAAARDHPELFEGDGLLDNGDHIGWYPTIHVPLIRALAPITGDYGTALMSLLGLHALLLGVGFYVLGRAVFTSRYWAFLLALAALMSVKLNLGEFWGLHKAPTPRTTFQALLPFVAACAYRWRATPGRWPLIMIAAGLLIYVHPVSAPAWGLALWLGFLAYVPGRWRVVPSVFVMLALGGLFLAVTVPFLWHYLTFQEMGPSASYAEVHRIVEARLLPGFLDLGQALQDFARKWASIPGRWIAWLWAFLGVVLLLMLRRRDKASVLVPLLWLVGVVIASVVLPLIDHTIARAHQSFPVQYDLIRGIRYLVPFLLLFSLWPLAEMTRRFRASGYRVGSSSTIILGGVLVAIWSYWHPPLSPTRLFSCWSTGRLACGWIPAPAADALRAIRARVPPGVPILATELELPIRYASLRPVVWNYKDGGLLAYVNHDELIEWNARKRELSIALLTEDSGIRLQRLAALGEKTGARFLFLRADLIDDVPTQAREVVWMNEVYALIALPEDPASAGITSQ